MMRNLHSPTRRHEPGCSAPGAGVGARRPSMRSLLVAAVALALVPGALGAQSYDDLLRVGRAQIDSSKPDAAVRTIEKAVKLNPQRAEGHFELGRALGPVARQANVVRQPILARRIKTSFEKAVELDANHVGAHEGLLQFYLHAPGVMGGSVAKAREQVAAIARLRPLRGHFAAATVALDQKDAVAAEKAFRAAHAAFPDSLSAVTSLANFLANAGRGEEAFAPLDRYLERHPSNRSALYSVGRTAAITGTQLDRGERTLRRLLETPSDSGPSIPPANVHFRLGDIAAKRGDKVKARAEYNEALRLNPRLEAAKRALAAL